MSLLTKGGITKLSELDIDANKDMQAKELSNLKGIVANMVQGDVPYRGAAVIDKVSKGLEGLYLKQGSTAPLWSGVKGKPLFRYETLLPGAAVLPTANPPALTMTDGANFSYETLDFDKDTEEKCYWVFNLSPDYTDEDFLVIIRWKSTAVAGDVKWGLSVRGVSEGQPWDGALGVEQTVVNTCEDVAGEVAFSTIANFPPYCIANDTVVVKLARKAADGLDTMDADACITECFLVFAPKSIISTFTPITPSTVTPGVGGSWQTVDCSAIIASGATGVIVHYQSQWTSASGFGLRKPGSTDNRMDTVYQSSHCWGFVGVDENRRFECQIAATGDSVKVEVIGYTTTGVTFFVNGKDKSITSTLTWTTINLAADCPNAKLIILEIVNRSGGNAGYGFRKYGSSDENNKMAGDDTAGFLFKHSWAIIGCDDNQRIQAYIDNLDVDFWVVGYVTEGAAGFTNSIDKTPTIVDTYVEFDCSAEAPGANMLFFEVTSWGMAYKYAIRKKGDAADDYHNCYHHPFVAVECDSEQKVEIKISNYSLTHGVKVHLVGYSIPSA